jgi:hypothetical protein
MSKSRFPFNAARGFAVLAALLVTCVAGASPASAVDVTLQSCAQAAYGQSDENSAKGWVSSTATGPLAPNGSCPAGLSFDTSAAVPVGTSADWYFQLPQKPTTNRVTLKIDGGETSTGFRYSLAGCPGCASFYDLSTTRDGSEGPLVLTFDGLDVSMVKVQATCVFDPCAPATPLSLHDLTMRVHDVSAPTILAFESWGNWQKRAAVMPVISVMDHPGVGLNYASYSVDGAAASWSTGSQCTMVYPAGVIKPTYGFSEFCPEYPFSSTGPIDLHGVKDGQHTLSATAVDGVGNSTTVAGPPIKIDDSPPEAPEDITVSDVDEGGWTAKDRVNFGLTMQPSDPELGQQSPVSRIFYTRKATDPVGVVSDPFDKNVSISNLPAETALNNVQIPSDGSWLYWFWAVDEAGNIGPKGKVQVRRDRTSPPPPLLATNAWINRDDLIAGYHQKILVQSTVGIEAGICGYLMTTNATENSTPSMASTKFKAPTSELPLPASTSATDKWVHVRSLSCNRLLSDTTATTALRIDDADPVIAETGVSPGGWTNAAPTVTLNASDTDSGVKDISYWIDAGATNIVAGVSTKFTLPAGDHVLHYSATDNAKNVSTVQSLKFQIDAIGPQASFEPRDFEHPTRLAARVADVASGVADARIEYRRLDQPDPSWHDLPTAAIVDPSNPKGLLISTTVPDADLPPGSYGFQVATADVAGNHTSSDLIGDTDVAMRLSLPIRTQNRLNVALAKFVKTCNAKKRTCKSDVDLSGARKTLATELGRPVAVVGELRDGNGVAIEARTVRIFETIGDRPRVQIADATTDASGRFRFATTADASSRVTALLSETDTALESSSSAELRVASKARLTVNKRTVKAGDTLRFGGRLLGSPSGFSLAKIPVVLEFLNGHTPQTGIGRTKTDMLGNFTVPGYKWKTIPKSPYVLKVRAAITAGSTSWPYDDGYSNWVSIRVRR